MQQRETDITIIGTGTAGMAAYKAAKKSGQRVIVIEGGAYGTTCARVGCMPSKLLIAAAENAHQLEKAKEFGIHLTAGYRVDGHQVMQRVRRERDRFANAAADMVLNWPEEDRLRGYARFIDANTLETDTGFRIHTRTTVIATGSSPFIPAQFQEAGDRLICNEDLFNFEKLPDSVAVFGPGVIGLELGQALHRLGVRVRLFGRGGSIGPLQDEKIRDLAREIFNQEFSLLDDAQVETIQRSDQGVDICFVDQQGQACRESYDYLLAATGRRPNLESLNLEAADLQLNPKGSPTADPQTGQLYLKSGKAAPIFIAGDVQNYRPLLHEANDEGHIAGQNAASWPDLHPVPRRTPLAVVFTDPQMALVGASLPQLQERLGSENLVIGEVSFHNQGRSRVLLVNKGLLRVYANKESGVLLGAEMLGPAAEHLAHLLAWSIQQQLSVPQLLELPFYHPVIEEGLRSALRSAAAQLD
ncbi:dihydrolipoyl dehydrogenase [Marinospirillum sp.]|uniref:dihydrolipoyl dehydrogenase n=1 Tax=Marinospirillum sp. TaxID=2183934 RepID=UPI00384C9997